MPGTAINAIDYTNNDDTSSLIEEALGQTPSQQQSQIKYQNQQLNNQ